MWEHLAARLLAYRGAVRKWGDLWQRLQAEVLVREDFWRRRILWAQVADGTVQLQ